MTIMFTALDKLDEEIPEYRNYYSEIKDNDNTVTVETNFDNVPDGTSVKREAALRTTTHWEHWEMISGTLRRIGQD